MWCGVVQALVRVEGLVRGGAAGLEGFLDLLKPLRQPLTVQVNDRSAQPHVGWVGGLGGVGQKHVPGCAVSLTASAATCRHHCLAGLCASILGGHHMAFLATSSLVLLSKLHAQCKLISFFPTNPPSCVPLPPPHPHPPPNPPLPPTLPHANTLPH